MRKYIAISALTLVFCVGGCRSVNNAVWQVPKWVDGDVMNVYTGNGHYDGKKRWDNFTRNYQKIWNFVDIYFWNYDIRDPYLGTPFFGDPN